MMESWPPCSHKHKGQLRLFEADRGHGTNNAPPKLVAYPAAMHNLAVAGNAAAGVAARAAAAHLSRLLCPHEL